MLRFFLIICMLCFSTAAFGELTLKQKQIMAQNRHKYWKRHQWKKQQQEKTCDVVVVEEEVTLDCPRCNGKGTLVNRHGAGWVKCEKCDGKGKVTRIQQKKKKVYTE